MLKTIRDSFGLTNKYIVLATPLILFSLISSLYLAFSLRGNAISTAIAVVLFFLMCGAFLSGWFLIIARCVKNPEFEDPNNLLKEFPEGVGEYFLPTIGMLLLSFVVGIIMFFISYYIGMKFIGDPGIPSADFSAAMASVDSLKTFLTSLPNDQLIKLNLWNMLLFFTMSLTYFVIMFYSPALFFKSKNAFIALFKGLKDIFSRHFFKNVLLFLFIFIAYSLISVLITIFGGNIFTHFIFTLVNFYFFTYAVVLVYNYYYNNFVKIGSNVDTRV